ncbi:hypothetical protein PIIN_11008 [Serendipita indica DSM 11827]|uniref:Uncharacterized protein n=1 Tax=Serendipita indica (strain DSM 11827) TaxID=1109443 RepID=G4U0D0_SERID|nr:hypothetical protein PIIN_11008 [Serendipita indica DSM 11827]
MDPTVGQLVQRMQENPDSIQIPFVHNRTAEVAQEPTTSNANQSSSQPPGYTRYNFRPRRR